jgi:glycosyltransferase family protein
MIKKLKNLYYFYSFYYKTKEKREGYKPYNILSAEETLKRIIEHKLSISRYGDADFRLLTETGDVGYQKPDHELAVELQRVLMSTSDRHLICIPIFLNNFRDYRISTRFWCLNFLNSNWKILTPYLRHNYTYGNANVSRFYLDTPRKNLEKTIQMFKELWEAKDVLIVEGTYSRLGVGNDLFENCKSIQRIICPAKNAFSIYTTILDEVLYHGKNKLILMALGSTATVMAYDLSQKGYWAVDVGHIDMEYVWYLMKAETKVPIPGRILNEVNENQSGDIPEEYREDYISSIIKTIEC